MFSLQVAVGEVSRTRLRPIRVTTHAIVGGSSGAQWRLVPALQTTAMTIIGGLHVRRATSGACPLLARRQAKERLQALRWERVPRAGS